jgi:hypothetical protein
MPAINPRLTITLKPEVHAVLRRLSDLAKNSQSSMVAELLESALPMFHRMIAVLEAAQKLKAEGMQIPDEFRAGLDAAQTKLEGQLGLNLDAFDLGVLPIIEAAEKVQRRAGRAVGGSAVPTPARPARRASTPMSNRGVTPHQIEKKVGKTPSRSTKAKGV